MNTILIIIIWFLQQMIVPLLKVLILFNSADRLKQYTYGKQLS